MSDQWGPPSQSSEQPQPGWNPPSAPQKQKSGAFKAGFLGCFGVLAAVLLVIVVIAVVASSGSDTATPNASESESAATTPVTEAPTEAPAAAPKATTAPKATKARVILSRSGNGISKTRKFTVDDSWEIRWSNLDSDGVFQLYVYDQDGLSDVAANTDARTSDVWPGTDAGTFYVEVNASGPWKLTIVDTP